MRNRICSIIGLLIVGLGLILWGCNLSGFSERVELYWPMIIVALGVGQMSSRSNRLGGMGIVATGVFVQLSNLGLFVLQPRPLARFWPLILVGAALWQLRSHRGAGAYALLLLLLGFWLQLSYFGLQHIGSQSWWPLVIVASGLWTVFGSHS